MTITEQDIKNLTPEHRIVWKDPGAPREVEMGLWVDRRGRLWTDAGNTVRYTNGSVPTLARSRIVRIIEPPLTPRRGLVIGKPGGMRQPLACFGPDEWRSIGSTYSDAEACDLIENYGWKVVDDLTKEKGDD